MTDRKSILANIAALASGQLIAMSLGFVTHAILARAVGPSDYGILGFAVAITSYFGIIGSLGTDTWATREIAAQRARAREFAQTAISVRLALSAIAYLMMLVMVFIWQPASTVATMILVQGVSLFIAATSLDFAFQGIERLDAVARRQVLAALIALAAIAASLNLGGGIVAASICIQVAAAISVAVMFWEFSRSRGWPRLSWSALSAGRRIIKESVPLAVTVLIVTVYTYIDIVMLGFMRPGADVGHYVAATRILAIGLIAASVIRTAILPVLARLHSNPIERQLAGAHHAKAVTAIGGLAAAGGFVLAPEILEIVFGADFREGASALRILMACLLFMNVVEVFQTQLVAWRLQVQQMWIMIAGAILNIGLNFALIPNYGTIGAAFATLASTIAILILAAITLKRHGFETHGLSWASPLVLAAVVALGASWIDISLQGALVRFLAIGSSVTIVYVGLAMALRIVRPAAILRYFRQP